MQPAVAVPPRAALRLAAAGDGRLSGTGGSPVGGSGGVRASAVPAERQAQEGADRPSAAAAAVRASAVPRNGRRGKGRKSTVGGSGGTGVGGTTGSAGAGGGGGTTTGACTPALPHGKGKSTVSLQFGGMNRSYILYIPPAMTAPSPAARIRCPRVHVVGRRATDAQQVGSDGRKGGLRPHRSRRRQQVLERRQLLRRQQPGRRGASSAAMVKKATAELCIDSKRVYVSGHSNGGAMTYRLVVKPRTFSRRSPRCAGG